MATAAKIMAAIGTSMVAAAVGLQGSTGLWVGIAGGVLNGAAAILGTEYADSKAARKAAKP